MEAPVEDPPITEEEEESKEESPRVKDTVVDPKNNLPRLGGVLESREAGKWNMSAAKATHI